VKDKIDGEQVVVLITKVKSPPEVDMRDFTDWLIEVLMTGGTFPGFWSAELVPPPQFTDEIWTIIQKFRTVDQANAWKQSETLQKLMAWNVGPEGTKAAIVHQEISTDSAASGIVATAIVTNIVPKAAEFFRKWELKIQKAQARFPGYRGTYWQPPVLEKSSQYTTLLRFDTPASLEHWMASDERKRLLTEATDYVASTKFSSLTSAFPGWFPANPKTGEQPPNWETSMLVLAALFPIIMLCIRFIGPLFATVNFVLFNFFSTVCNMIIVTWLCMPILIKVFTWWLFPNPDSKMAVNLSGISILLAVYGLEIFLLWTPK
jgi:uncharacterized protein